MQVRVLPSALKDLDCPSILLEGVVSSKAYTPSFCRCPSIKWAEIVQYRSSMKANFGEKRLLSVKNGYYERKSEKYGYLLACVKYNHYLYTVIKFN